MGFVDKLEDIAKDVGDFLDPVKEVLLFGAGGFLIESVKEQREAQKEAAAVQRELQAEKRRALKEESLRMSRRRAVMLASAARERRIATAESITGFQFGGGGFTTTLPTTSPDVQATDELGNLIPEV